MRPADYGVLILCASLLSWHRTSDARDTYTHTIETGKVEVSWTLEDDNLAMAVSAATKGYLALGFSESGMMDPSTVVIGSVDGESSSISEWALNGKTAATIAPLLPSIITETSAEELNGVTTVRFERPLIHDGRSIDPNNEVTMIWALHDTSDTLRKHSSQGSFSINLKDGSVAESTPEITAHAILMWLAFGVLMPVAILAARFKYPLSGWFNIHSGSMMLSVILILASFGVIVSFKQSKNASHASGFHEILGFVIIAGTILQATGGIARPNKESQRRKSWFLQHSWTGRLSYFFGVLNLVSGIFYFQNDIETGNDSFTWLLAVIIICLGLFVIALIVGHFTKSNHKKNVPEATSLDALGQVPPSE